MVKSHSIDTSVQLCAKEYCQSIKTLFERSHFCKLQPKAVFLLIQRVQQQLLEEKLFIFPFVHQLVQVEVRF